MPTPPAGAGDPCGAGDRFASCVAGLLADGHDVHGAVEAAVASASRFVAGGGAAEAELGAPLGAGARSPEADDSLPVGLDAALEAFRRTRVAGGTAVATGGCFDLLHAGHVATLRHARSLGDCLVVLLNSDASVRRLKGSDRPLTAEADRAAVLSALDAVDAVVIFDEDTPKATLERLAPDVWAKGGDYAARRPPGGPARRAPRGADGGPSLHAGALDHPADRGGGCAWMRTSSAWSWSPAGRRDSGRPPPPRWPRPGARRWCSTCASRPRGSSTRSWTSPTPGRPRPQWPGWPSATARCPGS
ncbi:MAG: adenylyltransferase/cytidyltransferase family protein [Thermoleophilaceae bacterium]